VQESDAGWVVDSSDPDAFPRELARIAQAPDEVGPRATAARRYAEQHFTQGAFAEHFERALAAVAVT
jgi:glycosyltransferase involved in cell wall biosynthesis